MKFEVFEAKTLEDAKAKALEELNVSEEEIISTYEEKKGKLFKAGSVLFKAVKISTVADYIKDNLKELLDNMNIEAQFETNIRNSQINIKMYSDKNNILIGKNGQTLMAIQTILRQQVYNQINVYPHILLDVENYKEKKLSNLERNAKRIAKEVMKTKIDVELDNMNSYERRIIHNALADFKNISTTSEGEEPNRHIVIRYKKED
jgi:spoIIIJ-associated protein